MEITLRTKEVVTNVDIFNQDSYKVVANVKKVDLVNRQIIIQYLFEVAEGEDYRVDRNRNRPYTDNQLDNVFDLAGEEIISGESFTTELQKIFAVGIRRLLGAENAYGLSADDWEEVTNLQL